MTQIGIDFENKRLVINFLQGMIAQIEDGSEVLSVDVTTEMYDADFYFGTGNISIGRRQISSGRQTVTIEWMPRGTVTLKTQFKEETSAPQPDRQYNLGNQE